MDIENLSEKEVDYLKNTYSAYERGIPIVGPADFSRIYGVSRASAHRVLTNLSKKGYLVHLNNRGYVLSDTGKDVSSYLYRRHRVLEYALWKAGVPKEMACRISSCLESHLSQDDTEKIWSFIGMPITCPCGRPIPDRGVNE